MGKIKTPIMILGVLFVLLLTAFVSPLRDRFINHFFYAEGDYPYIAPVSAQEKFPSQQGLWTVDDNGWQYTDNNGKVPHDTAMIIGGNGYFFTKDGYMATGWTKSDGNWYYLSYTGKQETGWLEENGKKYYLDKDGKMVTGWNRIDNKNYYFGEDGILTSGWILQDSKYYYINEDGTPHTGWLIDGEKNYYLADDGAMHTGWLQYSGFWYYLGDSGAMVTGWHTIDENSYFFGETGEMYTGWLIDGGNTYYFNTDGKIAKGWVKLDDKQYYMDPTSGAMHTNGWVYDGEGAYFLDASGVWVPNKKVANGPTIALTFDDGPGKYTDRLLACLKENEATATFFVLGSLVDQYPNTLKEMVAIGCEIGNHSYSHATLTKLDEVGLKNEIDTTSQKIKAITGTDVFLVRPPGGTHNEYVRNIVNAPFIMWSLDTLDWQSKNTEIVVEKVLNNVKDGDIILLHDIHITSVEAAEVLIPTLKEAGYNLVTVSELATSKGKIIEPTQVYNSFR